MWYEYEPLLTSAKLRASTPPRLQSPNPNAPYYPRYCTNSHSSAAVYPSCQTYVLGMSDYHYQYRAQGFKTGLNPPSLKLDFLSGCPSAGPVRFRWVK